MKFKAIFIIFNIVVIVTFIFISFISPLLLMGPEGLSYFLAKNFWVALIFVVFIVVFNVFLARNWKLYSYLDSEDWQALKNYLEDAIFNKGQHRRYFYKLLLNTYIVTSDLKAIRRLEELALKSRPQMLDYFALYFSIPYLLANIPAEAEDFFNKLLARPHVRQRGWLRWNLAFSLLQNNKTEQAKSEFLSLLEQRHSFLIKLLSLYLLEPSARREPEVKEKLDYYLNNLRSQIKLKNWPQILKAEKNNLEALMLSQIINEAANWFFQSKTANDDPTSKAPKA